VRLCSRVRTPCGPARRQKPTPRTRKPFRRDSLTPYGSSPSPLRLESPPSRCLIVKAPGCLAQIFLISATQRNTPSDRQARLYDTRSHESAQASASPSQIQCHSVPFSPSPKPKYQSQSQALVPNMAIAPNVRSAIMPRTFTVLSPSARGYAAPTSVRGRSQRRSRGMFRHSSASPASARSPPSQRD
jgi:hypothetical protein